MSIVKVLIKSVTEKFEEKKIVLTSSLFWSSNRRETLDGARAAEYSLRESGSESRDFERRRFNVASLARSFSRNFCRNEKIDRWILFSSKKKNVSSSHWFLLLFEIIFCVIQRSIGPVLRDKISIFLRIAETKRFFFQRKRKLFVSNEKLRREFGFGVDLRVRECDFVEAAQFLCRIPKPFVEASKTNENGFPLGNEKSSKGFVRIRTTVRNEPKQDGKSYS